MIINWQLKTLVDHVQSFDTVYLFGMVISCALPHTFCAGHLSFEFSENIGFAITSAYISKHFIMYTQLAGSYHTSFELNAGVKISVNSSVSSAVNERTPEANKQINLFTHVPIVIKLVGNARIRDFAHT